MPKFVVERLWKLRDNYTIVCVQNVYNHRFIHHLKNLVLSYTQFVLAMCTALVNTFFMLFTSFNHTLYTLSTQPIITIYINKRVEE